MAPRAVRFANPTIRRSKSCSPLRSVLPTADNLICFRAHIWLAGLLIRLSPCPDKRWSNRSRKMAIDLHIEHWSMRWQRFGAREARYSNAYSQEDSTGGRNLCQVGARFIGLRTSRMFPRLYFRRSATGCSRPLGEAASVLRTDLLRIVGILVALSLVPPAYAADKFPDYPVRPASDYAVKTEKAGVTVGVQPIEDLKEQKTYFHTELSPKGFVPVFVVI